MTAAFKESACTDNYSTQDSCDADSKCTWCKSAAVNSKCYAVEDAAALPPSIFACDNAAFIFEQTPEEPAPIPAEEFEEPRYLAGTDCENDYTDQSSCDSDSQCSWCKCSAVPSKCYNKEDAKNLP